MAKDTHLLILVGLLTLISLAHSLEMHKASQCFKSRGIPKVEFSCPPGHMVKIHKAFHGIAADDRDDRMDLEECPPTPGHRFNNCTQCPNDCVDDSMNLVYDWSTCMGNSSCTRTVMQSYMPACKGRDKFSDYLQVEYQCVPRYEVLNICKNIEKVFHAGEGGYIMSPNYPYNYPVNQDCICKIYTDWSSRIQLSLYDLLLETKNGRCRADWLMLRQGDQKHRHCGAIMTGTKNITSDKNQIEIQFHSDENDNRTQNFQYFTRSLKGFWLHFEAVPAKKVTIACRRLGTHDLEVKEIARDDQEFEELMTTPEAPKTTKAPKKKTNKSSPKSDTAEENEVPKAGEGGEKKRRMRPKHRQNGGGGGKMGKPGDQEGQKRNPNMQDSGSPQQVSNCFVSLVAVVMVTLWGLH